MFVLSLLVCWLRFTVYCLCICCVMMENPFIVYVCLWVFGWKFPFRVWGIVFALDCWCFGIFRRFRLGCALFALWVDVWGARGVCHNSIGFNLCDVCFVGCLGFGVCMCWILLRFRVFSLV